MNEIIAKTEEEQSTEHLLSKKPEELTMQELSSLQKALGITMHRRIANALIEHKGKRKIVATALDISERTLYRKIRELTDSIRAQIEANGVII